MLKKFLRPTFLKYMPAYLGALTALFIVSVVVSIFFGRPLEEVFYQLAIFALFYDSVKQEKQIKDLEIQLARTKKVAQAPKIDTRELFTGHCSCGGRNPCPYPECSHPFAGSVTVGDREVSTDRVRSAVTGRDLGSTE
jgi:hypothetical protein